MLTPADFAWTGPKCRGAAEVGDLVAFTSPNFGHDGRSATGAGAGRAGALLAIDNATGEIKAMVGGYDFGESKFNRATQAMRQTGSSFKVYVYSEALEQGMSPFDTVVDAPVTFHSGGQITRRTTTTKNSRDASRCAARWPIRATCRRCGCSTKWESKT